MLPGNPLTVFISYAREDAPALRMVEEGLLTLGHKVWIDKELRGGQDWWTKILEKIRECDVMVVAVSPALLESEAAAKERTYARELGKTVLPVQVDPVLPELLPADIAHIQLVDYTNQNPMAGFLLAAALATLPPGAPLPENLPVPPPRPLSPLAGLASRLNADLLSLDDQLAIVASLRVALDRAREQAAATELLAALRRRRDLYHATWQALDELTERERMLHQVEEQPRNVTAPGWYPDPSGRYSMRWYDEGDWTIFASNGGPAVEDPDF
jgi:TIR domain/Protein of unknown function (DUF2510)